MEKIIPERAVWRLKTTPLIRENKRQQVLRHIWDLTPGVVQQGGRSPKILRLNIQRKDVWSDVTHGEPKKKVGKYSKHHSFSSASSPPHCFVLQQINVFKLQTETEIRRFTVKYPVKHWRSYFVDIQDLATTQLTTLASSFPLIKSSHQDPDELSH